MANRERHAPEVNTVKVINDGMDQNNRALPTPRTFPQPSTTDAGNPFDGSKNAPFDPLAPVRKPLGGKF